MLAPDPDLLTDVVASKVIDAWHAASGALAAGLDVDACRAYLREHAPDLVSGFDRLVARAISEA